MKHTQTIIPTAQGPISVDVGIAFLIKSLNDTLHPYGWTDFSCQGFPTSKAGHRHGYVVISSLIPQWVDELARRFSEKLGSPKKPFRVDERGVWGSAQHIAVANRKARRKPSDFSLERDCMVTAECPDMCYPGYPNTIHRLCVRWRSDTQVEKIEQVAREVSAEMRDLYSNYTRVA